MSKRSKAENKGKKGLIAQFNDKDVFQVSVFTRDKRKKNEGRSREIKIREAGERVREAEGFISPRAPNRGSVDSSFNYI